MKKLSMTPKGTDNAISDGRAPRRNLLLYVEDVDDNWEVARLRLERTYDLIRASNDVEACTQVAAHGMNLYAILMDIELKGSRLDGIELTKLIRGKLVRNSLPDYARTCPVLTELPILFVTAYGGRYSAPELLSYGGNRLINKPVDFMDLTLTLTRLNLDKASRFGGKNQ